jgi:RNA 3'-terminal phosphate cyclase (ATP)
MITIDGSLGEGGGQILRSSLALSALLGRPIHINNIRQNRDKPGLARQHLAAVRAAAAICDAEVEGDQLHSRELTFRPGAVRGGEFSFDIGSAGSTTLVLQTVLYPLLLAAGERSQVTVIGGTHNPMAPTAEFLAEAFLPILRRMGAEVSLTVERPGFYPKGGGRLELQVAPCARLSPLSLAAPSPVVRREARALLCRLPDHVARRELAVVRERLDWDESECLVVRGRAVSPGNALLLLLEHADGRRTVFSSIGERGKPAERVAEQALDELERYLGEGAAVERRLADQLLLPCALAGDSTLQIGPRAATARPTSRSSSGSPISGSSASRRIKALKS